MVRMWNFSKRIHQIKDTFLTRTSSVVPTDLSQFNFTSENKKLAAPTVSIK